MPVDWLVQAAARVGTMIRLVETVGGGNGRVAKGRIRQETPAESAFLASGRYPTIPAVSRRGVRQMCASSTLVQLAPAAVVERQARHDSAVQATRIGLSEAGRS